MKITGKRITYSVLITIILLIIIGLATRVMQGPMVTVYRIQNQPLIQTVVATGQVTSASRAQVGAEITGVVVERRVQEGDEVKAGDVLAVLNNHEQLAKVGEAQALLAELQESSKPQADAALKRATAQLEQAKRETARTQELLSQKLLSQEALEQAKISETEAQAAYLQAKLVAEALASGKSSETVAKERLAAAKAALQKTEIRAQVSGTILTRNVEPGDLVQPGRILFEIAQHGQTELLVPVDERNLSVLKLGQSALCVTDAYPDQPFSAKVSFIAPVVDSQRGSVDIRLQLASVPEFLRHDMTVTVNIETGRREQALVIPNDALHNINGTQAWIWKVNNKKQLQRVQVELGLRGLVQSEIISGITDDDLVISDINTELVEGTRVRPQEEILSRNNLDSATARETPIKFN